MIDRGELLRKLTLNVVRMSGLAPLADRLFGGIGAIMMLHRVGPRPEAVIGANRHLTIQPEFLDAVLTEIAARGYEFVTMDEAVERIRAPKSTRFVTFTADDAYRDNLTIALPIFEKHGAPLTIYVAPALIEGTVALWWDVLETIVSRRDSICLPTPRGPMIFDCATPADKFRANTEIHNYLTTELPEEEQFRVIRDLARDAGVDAEAPRRETLMDWNELRGIARHPLVTIGAHTVNHYNLMRLSEDKARREIADAADILAVELGAKPRHMAYPYGYPSAVGPREVTLAREAGYASAVTTRHGVLQHAHAGHLHALPRISVNGRYQRVQHVRTMLTGVTTVIANRGQRVVTV